MLLVSNIRLVLFLLLFDQFCRLEKGRNLYCLVKNISLAIFVLHLQNFSHKIFFGFILEMLINFRKF